MSETVELRAVERDIIGHASRRLAQVGMLPAVVYGLGDSTPLSIDRHDAELLMAHEGVATLIVRLGIEGRRPMDTVVKSVQTDPVKGFVRHIDFLAVSGDKEISTQVQLHFVGDSAGVRGGGVLMHSLQSLHIHSLPKDLPDAIEVDVTALEVGDNLTVGQLVLPAGITTTDDADLVVCSVTPPTVTPSAEESAAAPAPEVIGEGEEES